MHDYATPTLSSSPAASRSSRQGLNPKVTPPYICFYHHNIEYEFNTLGGKGTFARMLADQYGVVEVGTGSLLRVHMREGTPLGKKAKAFVESGSLVPDELIISIIKQRLGEQDCREKGWVLDGFPRTGRQARALVEAGLCSGVQVVKIDVSDEIVTRRISNRRVDPVTGSVYHLLNKPPPSREIAQRLEQRKDDTETVIRKRLGIYKEHVGGRHPHRVVWHYMHACRIV